MLAGLRTAFRKTTSDSSSKKPLYRSSTELDEALLEDSRTRKQCLGQFCWYQDKIQTRNAAEMKLKQSYCMYHDPYIVEKEQ